MPNDREVLVAASERLKRALERGTGTSLDADEVQVLGTSRVRRYETFLFFEIVRLQGEKAYLETHLAEIDKLLGSVGP